MTPWMSGRNQLIIRPLNIGLPLGFYLTIANLFPTLIWYRQRGEVSKNGIKELKIGFGMERMPCAQFEANAAFFRAGMIAHNLFVLFEHSVLGGNWQHHRVVTVHWRLFHLPGKGVRHACTLVLKIAAEFVELFQDSRTKSYQLAQSLAP